MASGVNLVSKNTPGSGVTLVQSTGDILFWDVENHTVNSRGKDMGELHTLLYEYAQRRTSMAVHEMALVREPVWTWLSNQVESVKNVDSTEAVLGDVWIHLCQTERDRKVFALCIQSTLQSTLQCTVCQDDSTKVQHDQSHPTVMARKPALEQSGFSLEGGVSQELINVLPQSRGHARCPKHQQRTMQPVQKQTRIRLPTSLEVQMSLLQTLSG